MQSNELEPIVKVLKEYVDARVVPLEEWAGQVGQVLQAHQEALNHPALVVDYRQWIIDTAVNLGVTPKELIEARKSAETVGGQDEDDEG